MSRGTGPSGKEETGREYRLFSVCVAVVCSLSVRRLMKRRRKGLKAGTTTLSRSAPDSPAVTALAAPCQPVHRCASPATA